MRYRFIAPIFLLVCCLLLPRAAFAYGVTAKDKYPEVVSEKTLRDVGARYILSLLSAAEETRRHTVDAVYVPRMVRVPSGRVSFEASAPGGVRYWGSTSVFLNIIVDDVPFRQVKCQFRVRLFDRVAVAARLISPGQPIRALDFRLEEREVGIRSGRFIGDEAEILGRIVSRPVNAGTPILRSMLRQPVVVEPGSPVKLIAKIGGVEVRMDGIALQSGRIGESIRVRNTESKKVLRGRVIDAKNVEILN